MTSERKDRRRRAAGERGQVIVEMAIVSIAFFMLVLGIVDGARLFQSWVAVQHASREGARFAITGATTCPGFTTREACIKYAAKKATAGIYRGGVNATDANVAVTWKAWDFQGNTSAWTGPTANKSGLQCDQVEVDVAYRHDIVSPLIKVFAPSGILLHGKQRMVNEPFGPCASGDGVG